jgi:antitoxin component YwqK of YwqJK toxin-antitoxin module
MRFKLLLLISICIGQIHHTFCQVCKSELNLYEFNLKEASYDSIRTFSTKYFKDSTISSKFTKLKKDTFLVQDYFPGGKLRLEFEALLTQKIDTEFIEDEYGDLTPIPIKHNWDFFRVGSYKEYDWNGKIKTIGQYKRGFKNGHWLLFGYLNHFKLQNDTTLNCYFRQDELVGYYRKKQFYYDDATDSRKIYLSAKGKFALVNSDEIHQKGSDFISTKIGIWHYYNHNGELIKEEKHDFKGDIIHANFEE